MAHIGSCTELKTVEFNCDECDDADYEPEPICASDGNVYKTKCELKQQTCGMRVVEVALQNCATTKFCEANCDAEQPNYVCGSDNKLYRSECHMRKENCGKYFSKICSSQFTKACTDF